METTEDGTFSLQLALGTRQFNAKGEADDVFRALETFVALVTSPSAIGQTDDDAGATGAGSESGGPGGGVDPSGDADSLGRGSPGEQALKEPLKKFLADRALGRGNHVVALGIVVWAKRHNDENSLSVDRIKDLWKFTASKTPANLPRDVGKAATEGWLERKPDGVYAVTGFGETVFDGYGLKA